KNEYSFFTTNDYSFIFSVEALYVKFFHAAAFDHQSFELSLARVGRSASPFCKRPLDRSSFCLAGPAGFVAVHPPHVEAGPHPSFVLAGAGGHPRGELVRIDSISAGGLLAQRRPECHAQDDSLLA